MPLVDIADPACPLPEVLILDASVLLELCPALHRQAERARRQAVSQFINRIGEEVMAGQLLCVAPVITLEECYFKIIQYLYYADLPAHEARLRASLGRPNVYWHDLYKDSPHLIQQYMTELRDFRAAVQGIPVVILEPEDFGSAPPALEPRMLHHIEHIPILPKDAYLLAVAERLDSPHIATLDADFRAASGWLHVYTVSP
jgi:predicted nucleic acid-binding protein